MTETKPPPEIPKASRLGRIKIWHIGLLIGFVAVAIADILDHRRFEPTLLLIAGSGFAAYWLLGWVGWRYALRFEKKLGSLGLLSAYLIVMCGLFLVATVIYLAIEHVYLGGKLF